MVYSNLNGTIFYSESGNIDPEDIGYETTLHEMEIYEKNILIVFGKLKHTFSQRNVSYLPIYLVNNYKVTKQIGVIEVENNKALEIFDDNNEVDVDRLNDPLIFGFVDKSFIDNSGSNSQSLLEVQNKLEKEEKEQEEKETKEEDTDEDDDDDVLKVKVKPSKISEQSKKTNEVLKEGMFEEDKTFKKLSPLVEENQEMANSIKKDFQLSPHSNWVQKFMKNENYGIHDVENNGDCLFAVIRDAFQQMGKKTTVKKLRAIVAQNVNEEVFENHRVLYNDIKGTINEYNRQLKEMKYVIEVTQKEKAEHSRDNRGELRNILEESERLKREHKSLLRNKQMAQSMIDEDLGDLQAIDSVDKFKEYVQTTSFWANGWAISVLEYELKMKLILLSERAYLDEDEFNVLLCGEVDKNIQNEKRFEPKHYIISTFSGDHYKLVTYKDRRMFEFFELPYHIKVLITNKCLEGNSGAFHYIKEMKNLKMRLGVEDEEEEIMDAIENSSLYNKDIVFMFHKNASNAHKPGMAKNLNEKIPANKRSQFIELSKIKDWRKKLHDSWIEAPFELDGKKWASVEHYYQSEKFRSHNPDFADLFSLHATESEIAKDVDLAICAGSKSGKATGKAKSKVKGDLLLRPKGIEIDPRFYGEKSDISRTNALRAKFTRNEDLRLMLLATKDSMLMKHNHADTPERDDILMKIRYEINGSS